MSLQVGIYLFDAVEVLDFAGPFEVFSTASRLMLRDELKPGFEVHLLAAGTGTVKARGGMRVKPDFTRAQHPPLDILVVPGGVVTDELQSSGLSDWLVVQSLRLKAMASICTGAFLLEKAGLFNEREVVTHWEDVEGLRAISRLSGSLLSVLTDRRFVEAKPWVHHGGMCRMFSSAGISAGIDLSLHLVAEFTDMSLALRTARQMDYDWRI